MSTFIYWYLFVGIDTIIVEIILFIAEPFFVFNCRASCHGENLGKEFQKI